MTQQTPTVEDATLSLRSPATVMDLERLGSFSPTRLSFARRLTRMMFEQQWQVSRTQFELDKNGHEVYVLTDVQLIETFVDDEVRASICSSGCA